MESRHACALAIVCLLALAACSTPTATPPPPTVAAATRSTEKGGARASEVTVTATVEKVDVEKRLVTLKGPDGAVETIRVSEAVRNLPQLKRGDEVIATYYQSVAFEVVQPGEKALGASAREGSGRAELGEKPGVAAARVVTIVADVAKLDRKNQQAVLRGPEGQTTTVDIQNPAAFDKVEVGDRVEITLTEAIAIDVQPAPSKK